MKVINNLLFWNSASEVLIRVIKIVSWVLLARILGPGEFGVFSVCFAFTAALFTLTDFGLSQGIPFRVNANLASELKSVLFYCKLKFCTSVLAVIIYLLISFVQKTDVKTVCLSLCLLGNLIILDQQNIISVYLKAQTRFILDLKLRLASSFLSVMVLCIAAVASKNALLVSIFSLISSLVIFPFYQQLSGIKIKKYPQTNYLKAFKNISASSIKTWVTAVFTSIFVNMDLFIGNHIFMKHEIGMYAASQKVLFMAQFPVAIVGQMFYQGLASDFQNNKADFIKKILYMFRLLLFVGLIASIILIIFYSELSKILFGSEFHQTGNLIKNMGFGLLGLYFYPIFALFSVFYDKLFPLVVLSLFLVVVNFGIIIFFSIHYGLQGLAQGSSAANLLLGFVFGLFVWHFIRSKIYRKEI